MHYGNETEHGIVNAKLLVNNELIVFYFSSAPVACCVTVSTS